MPLPAITSNGTYQPLPIPSTSTANPGLFPHTGSSFPRQSSFTGNIPGPSRWGSASGSSSSHGSTGTGGAGGGVMSGLSAMMKARAETDPSNPQSSPHPLHSSPSSNPHSGFHPASFGTSLTFSALALGVNPHSQYNNQSSSGSSTSYINSGGMGMSISPPHWVPSNNTAGWGSLGSGSLGTGGFGTSFSREREGRERELEARYVRDFTCCGKQLTGLHDLLEHYEEEHANLAPELRTAAISAAQASMTSPNRPGNPSFPIGTGFPPPAHLPVNHQQQQHGDAPTPPGMMDIEMDEVLTGPPTTPAALLNLQQGIPGTPGVMGTVGSQSSPWSSAFRSVGVTSPPQCVPPSVLSYIPPTPGSHASASRHYPHGHGHGHPSLAPPSSFLSQEQLAAKALKRAQRKAERAAAREEGSGSDGENGSTAGGEQKRFRCPIEGCGKVYKQANGLKYHMTRSINSGHGNVAAMGGLGALLGDRGGDMEM